MSKGYFNWLQKDVPVGEVEKYPEIDASGETTVKGMYVIGDLTGIPLLKLAAESGTQMIRQFQKDAKFQDLRKSKEKGILDFVIVGAGPAGIAAGLEALKHNYEFKILESAKTFSTICNFPTGKPIYAEPEGIEQISDLKINEGVKETLMEEVMQTAKTIALKGKVSLRAAKQVINNGYDIDLAAGCKLETDAFSVCLTSEDAKEGTSAFLEKRKPEFKGELS